MKITLSTEVLCTIITVCGVVISALISLLSAHYSASKELKKIERTWAREDETASASEFSEAMRVAILFAMKYNIPQYDVLAPIGALRAKESGELADVLDQLYDAVKRRDHSEADRCIDTAINLRRKSLELKESHH